MVVRISFGVSILFFAIQIGCSDSDSQKRSSNGSKTDSDNGIETENNPNSKNASLSFQALDFGTFSTAAIPSGAPATHLAVEAGYLDIRQSAVEGGSIKDYRVQSFAAMGGASLVAATLASGCQEVVKQKSPGGTAFSSVKAKGFYTGEMTFSGGKVLLSKKDSASEFNTVNALAADFKTKEKTIVVDEKPLPKQGAISLSQAFSTSFGVSVILDDVNTALAKTEQDLKIEEDGASGEINLAIVNFYSVSGKYVRCFIQPGAGVTLTKAMFLPLLPLQAITAAYVSQEAEVSEGVLVWKSTYTGSGVEDLGAK